MADTKSSNTSTVSEPEPVSLRNPLIASLLAWLFPGLGHFYQGRYPKAILFFCCIFPIFLYGCYLGSDKEYGPARNVYFSWRQDDKRLYFLPQACLGLATIPAIIQSQTCLDGSPWFGKLMAPPKRWPDDPSGVSPTLDAIISRLNNRFDLGTLFTVVAGLMNLLVIFDAAAGPLVYAREEEEEADETKTEDVTEKAKTGQDGKKDAGKNNEENQVSRKKINRL